MSDFIQKVYNTVKKIPRGRVAAYKDIAEAIDSPRSVRAVGRALSKNYSQEIPCHRVVCSNGKIGGYNRGNHVKVKILISEGVRIKNSRWLDLTIFRWHPTSLK